MFQSLLIEILLYSRFVSLWLYPHPPAVCRPPAGSGVWCDQRGELSSILSCFENEDKEWFSLERMVHSEAALPWARSQEEFMNLLPDLDQLMWLQILLFLFSLLSSWDYLLMFIILWCDRKDSQPVRRSVNTTANETLMESRGEKTSSFHVIPALMMINRLWRVSQIFSSCKDEQREEIIPEASGVKQLCKSSAPSLMSLSFNPFPSVWNIWLIYAPLSFSDTHPHPHTVHYTAVHLWVLLWAASSPAPGKATVTTPRAAHLHLSGSISSLRLSWQKTALGTESTMGAEARSWPRESAPAPWRPDISLSCCRLFDQRVLLMYSSTKHHITLSELPLTHIYQLNASL